MARENKLSTWLENNSTEDFLRRWNLGASSREALWTGVGYSNEGACYNAARNSGIIPGGPIRNGGDDGNKAPRKPRAKGVLPKEIERWAILSAQADFIRDGNDPDDFVPPEITPDVFLSLRAVKNETPAFVEKAIGRIGGFESEAGKALRQWAGQPLTRSQAVIEEQDNIGPRDRAVALNVLNSARNASAAFHASMVGLLFEQFGEAFFDRMIGNELLPI